MALGEAVRVLPVGQQKHLDVHPLGEKHVDSAYGGLDAGFVTIIEYGYVVGEPVDETYLSGRERGAA